MVRLVVPCTAVVALAACTAPEAFDAGADRYTCGSLTFTAPELADAPPAGRLQPEVRAAFDGRGHSVPETDLDDGWRVVEKSSDTVGLIRALEEPERSGPGDIRTHDHVRALRSRGATNVPDGDWVLDSAGVCAPRLDLGRLEQADLTLVHVPDPAATEIALEVYERACNSGEAAHGRVEVVRQDVTDGEVRLVIGVRPRGGNHECPSNPPTPVTVELDEPLGDRTVVDAAVLPPQPVPVARGVRDAG